MTFLQKVLTLCQKPLTMDEKPKSGYDRYNEIANKEKQSQSDLVPKAISIVGAISLVCGILGIFSKSCTVVEAFALIAGSFFFFGFSIIVQAAQKYLDK